MLCSWLTVVCPAPAWIWGWILMFNNVEGNREFLQVCVWLSASCSLTVDVTMRWLTMLTLWCVLCSRSAVVFALQPATALMWVWGFNDIVGNKGFLQARVGLLACCSLTVDVTTRWLTMLNLWCVFRNKFNTCYALVSCCVCPAASYRANVSKRLNFTILIIL